MSRSTFSRRGLTLQTRLSMAVLAIGTVGTLLLFGIQYATQKHHVLQTLTSHLEEIQESHRSSFARDLAEGDVERIQRRLEALIHVTGIVYAGLRRDGQVLAESGTLLHGDHLVHATSLHASAGGKGASLGEFILVADRGIITRRLWEHSRPYFYGTLAQVILIAGSLLLLVRWLVGRRLDRLARHLRDWNPLHPLPPDISRNPKSWHWDELDEVAAALQALQQRFLTTVQQKEEESVRRKASEEAERLAKRRLEVALAASDTGTWRWNPKTNADTRDANLNRILGLEAVETTQPVEDFISRIHPDDVSAVEAVLNKAMESGGLYDAEMRLRRPGGSFRWVRDRGRVFRDATGEIDCVTGAVIDITDRKEAELRLEEALCRERERNEEIQAILDSVPAAVWIAHDAGCLHIVGNRRAHELFRVPFGQNASKSAPADERLNHFRILREGREIPDTELPMQIVARTGEPVSDFEMDLVFEDDHPSVTLLGNAVALRDESGALSGAVGAFIDITGRKRAENDLRAALQSLQETNQNLEQFTYIASHDLQEPMRKVSAFCDRLRQRLGDGLDERAQRYMERIEFAAERMRKLIQDLLLFSRASRAESAIEPVALDDVVRDVRDLMEISLREAGAHLEVTCLPTVLGDPVQLRQVFQNLLSNALKFQPAGNLPRVRIACSCTAEDRDMEVCRLTVRDNGIGIDPAYAEMIFEPFRRLHARSEYEGSGIGLAICAKVIQRHGGRIEVESVPGGGSAFHLTLPLHRRCGSCSCLTDAGGAASPPPVAVEPE